VKVDKAYVFDSPTGKKTLADLFGPRSQLAIYHFMLTPGLEHICDGCAHVADHVDSARQHFEQADLSFAAVSRAPLERIEQVLKRMSWKFAWVSSQGSDFNHDFGVSFTDEQIANRPTSYNYGTTDYAEADLPGASVFVKDEHSAVYHSYSTYARGLELLCGSFNWLDLVPKGRNEAGLMSWLRLHDEYEGEAHVHSCCA